LRPHTPTVSKIRRKGNEFVIRVVPNLPTNKVLYFFQFKYIFFFCKHTYSSFGNFLIGWYKHKKEQHDPTFIKKRVQFICNEPGCGRVLQSKHAFATHNALLHSDRRKYYECHYCGRKFRTLGTIRTHVVEHATNPNELLTVACDFCEKKFVDEKSLRLHHRAHVCKYFYVSIVESMSIFCLSLPDSLQNNSVQCEKCSKTFSNSIHLRRHIKRMHDEFYYECCYCKGSFGSKQSLNYHLFEHRGFRPFHCTACPAQFVKQYV
jgi:uncharacterized Zn-finger protein